MTGEGKIIFDNGSETFIPTPTRLEVIDANGRSYVKYGIEGIEMQYQDDVRTLKIFVKEKEKE